MSKQKKKQSSRACQRWRQTWIHVTIFVLVYLGFLASGYILGLYLHTFTWMEKDMFYPFLHFLNANRGAFSLAGLLLGILFFVIWNYRKMYQLVDEEVFYAAQKADEAEQRKNDLVVYLAHDLKTPLTSVLGYLELLQEETQLPEQTRKHYIDVVIHKAERLEDLINEFFEITRYNLTHITLEYSEINLTRMLQQILFEFQPMLEEKGLCCELEAPDNYFFRCDSDRMQRVFDNLLRNACNYSFPGTKICIRLQIEKDEIFLEFENEGNTIPKEKLERIFEQFFRLDSSRASSTGGSGVGLAIAKEIVELHGGAIKAESKDNQILFQISLPVRKS